MDRAQENREKADEQAQQQQRGRMLPPPPPPHPRRQYAQQRMDADAAFQRQIQHQSALAREREQARQQSFVPDTCQAPNTNTDVLPAPATHLALPALPSCDAMRQQQAPKPVKKKAFQQQRRYQQKRRYHQQRHQHQKKQQQPVKNTPSQQQHQWHYQQNEAPYQQLAHPVVRAPEPVPYQVQWQWYQRQRNPLSAQELAQLQQYLQYHEQQYAQLPDIASDDGSQEQLQHAQPQQFQQGVQHYSTVTGGGYDGGELGQHQQQGSHWQQPQQYQQSHWQQQQYQQQQESPWQQQQHYQQYQLQPVNPVPAQGPMEYQPQQIQQGTGSESGDQWMPHHYSTVTGSGHGSEELGQYYHHQQLYQQPHLHQAQYQYQQQLPVANPFVGQEPAPYYHPHQSYHEQPYEQQGYQQQQQYQQYQLQSDHPMPAQLPVPYQQQPYEQQPYQQQPYQQQPYQQLYQHYLTTGSGNGIDGPIQHAQPPLQQFQQCQHYYSTVPGDEEDSSNRLQNSLLNLPTFGDGPPVPATDPNLYTTGRVELRAPPPATYEAHDPFMGYAPPPTPRTAAEAEYDEDWGISFAPQF